MGNEETGLTLVLGGTGKTGRRVATMLESQGVPVRIGSRSATPSFHWNDESSWAPCLEGVRAMYVSYAPDLAVPGATDTIRALVERARQAGIERIVILSGRGEEEAQACERIVQESGIDWTVVRASWFNQNFSEGAFVDMVRAGQISLPASDVAEPFVDIQDIAGVAVAALTGPGHGGQVYEVTGPRLLTFAEAAGEIARATGRDVTYVPIPHEAFVEGVRRSGAPDDVVWIMDYLFSTVLDGRNAYLTDGVERALGRPPRDFAYYCAEIASSGLWNAAEVA